MAAIGAAKPISVDEMAALFRAVASPHVLMFLVIAMTTMARPGAILDLRRSQFDDSAGTLKLNPPGRTQNKKRRPIVPVTPTLRTWLRWNDENLDESEYYVSQAGQPMKGIKTAFVLLRGRAGLSADVNLYSFRHGMAQALQDRSVPRDQIS
jgi:integrase